MLIRTSEFRAPDQSRRRLHPRLCGLTADGAQWLVDHGVELVGTDYLSVVAWPDLVPAHRIMLRAGMVLVEGLDLAGIAQGTYRLVCLPLRIAGGDGAPARAVLIEE